MNECCVKGQIPDYSQYEVARTQRSQTEGVVSRNTDPSCRIWGVPTCVPEHNGLIITPAPPPPCISWLGQRILAPSSDGQVFTNILILDFSFLCDSLWLPWIFPLGWPQSSCSLPNTKLSCSCFMVIKSPKNEIV